MRGRKSGRPYTQETARAELADGVHPAVVALRLGCDLQFLSAAANLPCRIGRLALEDAAGHPGDSPPLCRRGIILARRRAAPKQTTSNEVLQCLRR